MAPRDIMLVEDDDLLRRQLAQALGTRGFAVRTAPDGPAAIALIAERLPDVMVTDVRIPHGNGVAVVDFLRRCPGGARVPVIMTSGYDRSPTSGATGVWWLPKPFTLGALVNAVRRASDPRHRIPSAQA